jgi:chromosome segregation ATPase
LAHQLLLSLAKQNYDVRSRAYREAFQDADAKKIRLEDARTLHNACLRNAEAEAKKMAVQRRDIVEYTEKVTQYKNAVDRRWERLERELHTLDTAVQGWRNSRK